MSATIKAYINSLNEEIWEPLINKKGEEVANQDTCRTVHCIGNYEKAFTLIIQRTRIKGQAELDLDGDNTGEEIISGGYIYRAIATDKNEWSDSKIVHWYNQRGEDSEHRIKELKLDFGGDTLPCSDFNANTLYFFLSAVETVPKPMFKLADIFLWLSFASSFRRRISFICRIANHLFGIVTSAKNS